MIDKMFRELIEWSRFSHSQSFEFRSDYVRLAFKYSSIKVIMYSSVRAYISIIGPLGGSITVSHSSIIMLLTYSFHPRHCDIPSDAETIVLLHYRQWKKLYKKQAFCFDKKSTLQAKNSIRRWINFHTIFFARLRRQYKYMHLR